MKKMKFIAIAAAALAIGVLALAGCSSGGGQQGKEAGGSAPVESSAAPAAAAETSAAPAADENLFVVGFDQEYPPYGYVGKDGEFTGFDLELAQEVCARNGWTYVAQPINWDTKLTELNAGVFDCIWNGFTMEGREADYAFSEPYMYNAQVVLVKADSDIKALDDLAGKTVATQVDSAAWEVLAGEEADQADLAKTFAALETRDNYEIAVTELEAGAVDALACDLSIASYNMAQNPDKYRMLETPLSEEHYAVGFRKAEKDLADKVTATLREMTADGFVEKLCEKYASDGITFDKWVLK